MVTKSASLTSLIEAEQFHAHLTGSIGRHEGVVGDEPHAEGLGTIGDQFADSTETDDAKRLVGEFDTFPARALPAAGLQRCVGLRHIARLGEQ